MALQLSVAARNARLDAIATAAGASAKLLIFSGAVPANAAAADPAGLLATISLPATYFNAASAGTKTMTGTWSVAASAAGTAASFRLKDTAGTNTHIQGTVTATGGGGDLTLDNTNIASGQTVNVTTFTLTDANA